MKIIHTDILVLGLGSAGSAAVIRALSMHSTVVAVEQMPGPGGTSTYGGVNNWEPGVSLPGIHRSIATRLLAQGDAFVGKTTEYVSSTNRFAISDRSGDPYETTLKRFGVHPDDMRRLHYEPDAMAKLLHTMMLEADTEGRLTLFYNTRFVSLDVEDRRISTCTLATPDAYVMVIPTIVIDCTADILPTRMAGCTCTIGEESSAVTGETEAPMQSSRQLNGLTQCFRIGQTETNKVPQIPTEYSDVDLTAWERHMETTQGPVSCFNVYPRGGIYVNMLPTAEGEMYCQYTPWELKHICEARAYSYIRWLHRAGYLQGWEITHMFPLLGLRETWRLVGRYVLTLDDIRAGHAAPYGREHTIAIADHPADTHGRGSRCKDTYPGYQIPYECLLPQEIDNLLVACRGASFTHLALSSVRLSRTMLQLGEAAGIAAGLCIRENCTPSDIAGDTILSEM